METNNIEMITKMVIDAINKNEDKGNGFVVPIRSFRKTYSPDTGAMWRHCSEKAISSQRKKDLMGGQFASNELYDYWSETPCDRERPCTRTGPQCNTG